MDYIQLLHSSILLFALSFSEHKIASASVNPLGVNPLSSTCKTKECHSTMTLQTLPQLSKKKGGFISWRLVSVTLY